MEYSEAIFRMNQYRSKMQHVVRTRSMKQLKEKDWMSSHKSYPRFVLIQEASGEKKKKKKCDKVSLNTDTMQ